MSFDTHCHIHFRAFNADREQVIKKSLDSGWKMITVGTNYKTSVDATLVAEKYPNQIFATVGLHPVHLFSTYVDELEEEAAKDNPDIKSGFKSKEENFDFEKYFIIASKKEVVAIGETGLDFFHIINTDEKDKEIKKQKEVFIEHIKLAAKVNKPLVVHCRDAYKELAEILQNEAKKDFEKICSNGMPGTIHCFTGTWEEAKMFIDLGFCIGFTGIITFPARKSNPKAQEELLNAVKNVPLDRLLIETDAPYLAALPKRGMRAEPWMCDYVAEKIAEIRGATKEDILKATEENSKRLFRIV